MSENLSTHKSDSELKSVEQVLKGVDPKIFEGLNHKKKMEIMRAVSVTISKSHSGPLPDPDTLAKYDDIIANGAERIMKMAENQQAHRIRLEAKVIISNVIQSYIGQAMAFLIAGLVLGGGMYCIMNGHEIGGGIISSVGLTGLVAVFITGRRGNSANLAKKRNSNE